MAYRITGGRTTKYYPLDPQYQPPHPKSVTTSHPGYRHSPPSLSPRSISTTLLEIRAISPHNMSSDARQLLQYLEKIAKSPNSPQKNNEILSITSCLNELYIQGDPSYQFLLTKFNDLGLFPFPIARLCLEQFPEETQLENIVKARIRQRTHSQKRGPTYFNESEVKDAIEWLSQVQDPDTQKLLSSARSLYTFRETTEASDKVYDQTIKQNLSRLQSRQPFWQRVKAGDQSTPKYTRHSPISTPSQTITTPAQSVEETRPPIRETSVITLKRMTKDCINIPYFDPTAPMASLTIQLIENGYPLHSSRVMNTGININHGEALKLRMDEKGHNYAGNNAVHLIKRDDGEEAFPEALHSYIHLATTGEGKSCHHIFTPEFDNPGRLESALVTLLHQSRGARQSINDQQFLRIRGMVEEALLHIDERNELKGYRDLARQYFQSVLICMDCHRIPGKNPLGTSQPRRPKPVSSYTPPVSTHSKMPQYMFAAPKVDLPLEPEEYSQDVMQSLAFNTMARDVNEREKHLPLDHRIKQKQTERMEHFVGLSEEKKSHQYSVKTLTGDTFLLELSERGPVAEVAMKILQKNICNLYSGRIIYKGKNVSLVDTLNKRMGRGATDFASEGVLHVVNNSREAKLNQLFSDFFSARTTDAETSQVQHMMPAQYRTPHQIEAALLQIYQQMEGGVTTVYADDFIELQSHLQEAKYYIDQARMPFEDKNHLDEYLDTLLCCMDIYQLPFVGHQRAFLDEHIRALQEHRSEPHTRMSPAELIENLNRATREENEAEANRCLYILLQGMKFNLLTVNELAQIMDNPNLPNKVRQSLRPLIALHASQTTGMHSLNAHRARLNSKQPRPSPKSLPPY